jgi:proline iminopeptidase
MNPLKTGHLAVGDGATLYWEMVGNPSGVPVVHLHGGPGAPSGDAYRARFDLTKHRVISFDQRGCGRSRPLVTDDLTSLATNTTPRLVDDLEALRQHLGIDRWLVAGVSWGTALAVAYTLAHPDRVRGVVLTAVALTTRPYVDWITETTGMLLPAEWQLFEAASTRQKGERIVDAYARLLLDPDPVRRHDAALAWCSWESAHISVVPGADPEPEPLFSEDPLAQLVFATLVTHYWRHDGFWPELGYADHEAVLAGTASLSGIPAVLVHGRHDVSGPLGFAHQLQQAWPGSELIVVPDEGHGGPTILVQMSAAAARLASSEEPTTP